MMSIQLLEMNESVFKPKKSPLHCSTTVNSICDKKHYVICCFDLIDKRVPCAFIIHANVNEKSGQTGMAFLGV